MNMNREKRGSRSKYVTDQGGFTLTEVLVASSILVVAVLGIAALFPVAYNNIFSASQETKAAILAQHMMEQIKNAPSFNDMLSFAENPPTGATHPRPAYIATQRANWHSKAANATPQGEGLPGGNGNITITATGGSPHRLAAVTITMDWTGRKGPPVSLITEIAEDF
jgi:prepilin-type N-terminal cleavage/methylation domain-containing protein